MNSAKCLVKGSLPTNRVATDRRGLGSQFLDLNSVENRRDFTLYLPDPFQYPKAARALDNPTGFETIGGFVDWLSANAGLKFNVFKGNGANTLEKYHKP